MFSTKRLIFYQSADFHQKLWRYVYKITVALLVDRNRPASQLPDLHALFTSEPRKPRKVLQHKSNYSECPLLRWCVIEAILYIITQKSSILAHTGHKLDTRCFQMREYENFFRTKKETARLPVTMLMCVTGFFRPRNNANNFCSHISFSANCTRRFEDPERMHALGDKQLCKAHRTERHEVKLLKFTHFWFKNVRQWRTLHCLDLPVAVAFATTS